MRVDEFVAILQADGERLGEAAVRAGLDAAVPACPGWQIRDLIRHVGGVHRWAAGHVATGHRGPMPAEQERELFASPADDELLGWFRAGHRHVVDALTGADPAVQCWTFLPGPSPLAFWARRQAHETAIHRADAEAASGTLPEWTPEFAADGIDELLGTLLTGRRERITADPPVHIELRADDARAAWSIRIDAGGLLTTPLPHLAGRAGSGGRTGSAAPAATLTLTGTATDLYLLLWNRIGIDRLHADGDPDALQAWRRQSAITRD